MGEEEPAQRPERLAHSPPLQVHLTPLVACSRRAQLWGRYLTVPGFSCDVAPGDDRLLVIEMVEPPAPARIEVILDWFGEVERLAPAAR